MSVIRPEFTEMLRALNVVELKKKNKAWVMQTHRIRITICIFLCSSKTLSLLVCLEAG